MTTSLAGEKCQPSWWSTSWLDGLAPLFQVIRGADLGPPGDTRAFTARIA
jgi:hypothetical protein